MKRCYLLVVGARKNSLGAAVAGMARETDTYPHVVCTAGIANEDFYADVRDRDSLAKLFQDVRPSHVVVTVGVNWPLSVNYPHDTTTFADIMADSYALNVIGPMEILRAWLNSDPPAIKPKLHQHFVVISSNSAEIPRSNSLAYCASKAALSMAVRVAARELAGTQYVSYAYEPGFLQGTPMSVRTAEDISDSPLHRIPGLPPRRGLAVPSVARTIADNLRGGQALNGSILRLDGGEL